MPDFGLPATTIPKVDYDYLVYYTGTQYVALNGSTGAIDYTHATDGANVLNSAITAVNTAGGGIIDIKGTILCRSSVILKSLIFLRGVGDAASIKQDNSQNLAGALVDSFNFASLTGGGTSAGVYSVYIENLKIDGNRANNGTATTIGLRYYGYNWHLRNVHVIATHGIGHYSEWSTDPVSPSTGTTMNSYYDTFVINQTDGVGWQMRGPHDSQITNCTIYTCQGKGFVMEYLATKYDGSCEMQQMHIFDVATAGIDAIGGTLRFRGVTCESINGAGSVGLLQEGAVVEGVNYEGYLAATGLKLASGGESMFKSSYIHNNSTDGVEILKNNVLFDGIVVSNATKGIVIGNGSTQIANALVYAYVNGHTTAQIDWGNSTNKGVGGFVVLYCDAAHPTPILNEQTIDTNTNSFTYESFADSTGVRTVAGRPITNLGAVKSPFSEKMGMIYYAHTGMVAEGLYNGVIQSIAATASNDQWEGVVANYATTATSGTRVGLNTGTSATVTLFTRTSYPYKRTHLKVPSVTNTRFYGGFSSAAAIPNTDTPLANADSGVIVGWNSTDTNIKIYRNDGTGAAPTATDTAIAKSNSWWQYEIISDDAGGTFTVNIYTPSSNFSVLLNSRIPSASTRLATYDVLTNSTAAIQNLQINASIIKSRFIP